jgi:tetratricopeptide (TPR) repeat protein
MKIASILSFGLTSWLLPASLREARAIRAYRSGVQAFNEDDSETAVRYLHQAVDLMPGEKHFQDLEAYYSGHQCLDQRKYVEAAKFFQHSLDLDPQSKITRRMLLISQRHAAFEVKNFEGYFKLSEALVRLEGRSRDSLLAMAAAWACRSVLSRKPEDRAKAIACLEEARKLPGPKDPELENLDGWVRYILEKNQILSFTDYWYTIGKGGLDDQGIG